MTEDLVHDNPKTRWNDDFGQHTEPQLARTDPSGARKADVAKTRVDLLPPVALSAIAEVFTYGAAKYSDFNWAAGFTWRRIYAAAFRHLLLWSAGEDDDPETGLSHLAAAGCDIMMLLEFALLETGTDDRYKIAGAAEVIRQLPTLRRAAVATWDVGQDSPTLDALLKMSDGRVEA